MRFTNSAISAIAVVPYVDLLHHDEGIATLTPPAPGSSHAVLQLEGFTGLLLIDMMVSMEGGGSKKLLAKITNKPANDNEVTVDSNTKLAELKEIYFKRFGEPPRQMKKADILEALMDDDAKKSAKTTPTGSKNPITLDLEDSDDEDDEELHTVVIVEPNQDGAQDNTEDTPANPEGTDMSNVDNDDTSDEPANPDGNDMSNGDDDKDSINKDKVDLGGMKIAQLKQYWKDNFKGKTPSGRKADIIAFIKKKQAERDAAGATSNSDKENRATNTAKKGKR